MKRILLGFVHAILLMVSVMFTPVFAQQAAPEAEFDPEIVGDLEIPVNGWHAEFALDPDTTATENQVFFLWSEEVGRQMEFAVTDISIQENGTVRWQAQCIFDSLGGSHVGRWLVVELQPAPEGESEKIGWDWSSGYQEDKAQEMLKDEEAFPFLWKVQRGSVTLPLASQT
jgi:hypothetical protein